MKPILDFISNIFPITGDGLIDTVLFMIIAAVSFWVAWKLTGDAAEFTGLYNSGLMSALHWLIRVGIFLLLLGFFVGVVQLIHWIGTWPWWGYLIFGISAIVVIAGVVAIVIYKKKKRLKQTNEAEDD